LKPSEVTQIEWFNQHFYKVVSPDGQFEYYPSVTTILDAINKPHLIQWYGDHGSDWCNKYKIAASERGTREHYAFQVLLDGGVVIFNPRYRPNFTPKQLDDLYKEFNNKVAQIESQEEMMDVIKIRKMLDKVKPEILHTEMTVFSTINKWAGTTDLVLEIEEGAYEINGAKPLFLPGGVYVCDYKTGSTVDQAAHMQISAYGECLKEMGLWDKIAGGLIFHLQGKTKKGIEGLSTIYRSKEEMTQDYKVFQHVAELWRYQFEGEKPKVFTFPDRLTLTTQFDELQKEKN
jgi:hypothetical protein